MSQTITCYECLQPATKYIADKQGRVLCVKCDEKLQSREMREAERRRYDGSKRTE